MARFRTAETQAQRVTLDGPKLNDDELMALGRAGGHAWKLARADAIDFPLRGDHIALDSLLKATGLAASGGGAKVLIASGGVRVNGATETRRGRKLRAGASCVDDASCSDAANGRAFRRVRWNVDRRRRRPILARPTG